ncbi:MAG: kinase/pyrophosphorylase [Candidatus Cloacimonetes bacterium]|nr:kinase/pyrophosphorylase [Candidatus Cloacimonadota bacterium]MCF7814861.1 kinase/pyrophosphorylase [Candidatus Cloacimonadota bacterium]MCF7867512.1 kinase/pyrophosphorylase [Candidatus Cloacimonadota bacterium]MCF7882986.1 kinase/pyrophosphorylase [Candidatus Cloacimonadota bacterium]
MLKVIIVSDGTGKTAEMALNAALTQFAGVAVSLVRKPGIKSYEQIDSLIEEAQKEHNCIVHTLVSDKMRSYLVKQARLNNVETIDIMGPLLSRLSNLLAISPAQKPGLFVHLNEQYFRRVETMNFAFKHDDGLRAEDLGKAEIVLIGVSRTFKTPLSIYLAFKGWLVANVPIVKDFPIPSELNEIDPCKVFYLNTTAKRLAELRNVRSKKFNDKTGDYASYEFVRQELMYGRKICCNHPKWCIITVTSKSIEEIASEIVAIMRERDLD